MCGGGRRGDRGRTVSKTRQNEVCIEVSSLKDSECIESIYMRLKVETSGLSQVKGDRINGEGLTVAGP